MNTETARLKKGCSDIAPRARRPRARFAAKSACAVVAALLPCARHAHGAEPSVFVSFDLETTGLHAEKDRVVEIGLVAFTHTNVLAVTNWLIHPGMPIPPEARKIHGITDDMVADSPRFADVYPFFTNLVAGRALLAHNAAFDARFLRAEAHRNGLTLPDCVTLDTLRLFRLWFPEAPRHSLEALLEHLDMSSANPHRAFDDAEAVRKLFLKGRAKNALPPGGHPVWGSLRP